MNRLNARIVIGRLDGPRSSVWRVWTSRDEVYVASANSGGIEKLSFHSSRICRKAFTSEHGAPAGVSDRATIKWKRDATPVAQSGKGTCVLEVGVPTDYLSMALEKPKKAVTWVEPAPPGMATVLEMFFTRKPDTMVRQVMGDRVVFCASLPNGETFVVSMTHARFEGEDFYVPASHHAAEHFVFVRDHDAGTGRPIRMTVFTSPKDGDRMTVWEYGGYRGPVSSELLARGIGTFNRSQVLDHSSN